MDDKSFAELQQLKLEAEHALEGAKRRAFEDPRHEPEVEECRKALQRAQDRIEGFQLMRQEEAAAVAARAKQAAEDRLRRQQAEARETLEKRIKAAKVVDKHVAALCVGMTDMLDCFPHLPGAGLHAILNTEFLSARQLITARLVEAGVVDVGAVADASRFSEHSFLDTELRRIQEAFSAVDKVLPEGSNR